MSTRYTCRHRPAGDGSTVITRCPADYDRSHWGE